ncbi:MAG TPA: hypothetical protein VF149_04420, partial [Bacillales bacterium]
MKKLVFARVRSQFIRYVVHYSMVNPPMHCRALLSLPETIKALNKAYHKGKTAEIQQFSTKERKKSG